MKFLVTLLPIIVLGLSASPVACGDSNTPVGAMPNGPNNRPANTQDHAIPIPETASSLLGGLGFLCLLLRRRV